MRTAIQINTLILILVVMCSLPLAAETVLWVPAAASNPGAHGTEWTTDLWIHSRVADQPITVFLAFLPEKDGGENPAEVSVEVPVWGYVHVQDVVGSLFDESRAGGIRLRCDHEFEATSSTVNTGSDVGTFGQGIPAVPASTATAGAILMGASNLPTANGKRTNLGLLNTSTKPVELWVIVSDSEAPYSSVGDIVRFSIGPLGWWQGNVFDLVGARSVDVGNAVVNVANPRDDQRDGDDRPVISYLSVVDNASGDGTYVQPVNINAVFTLPVDWIIDLTVTAAAGVTLDQMTVTAADNDPQVFTDLSTSVQVTVDAYVGEFELCLDIEGTAEPGPPKRVTIESTVTPSYGDPWGRTKKTSGAGAFIIQDCSWIVPEPRIEYPDP